jgi:hypothetical protein
VISETPDLGNPEQGRPNSLTARMVVQIPLEQEEGKVRVVLQVMWVLESAKVRV